MAPRELDLGPELVHHRDEHDFQLLGGGKLDERLPVSIGSAPSASRPSSRVCARTTRRVVALECDEAVLVLERARRRKS
jgi:hypothetical protein